MNPPVHILGAGSLGLLLAARLQASTPVTLIRRPGDWPKCLRLVLEEGSTTRTLEIPQLPVSRLEDAVERVIVCTKAHDVLPALEQIRPSLAADAALLLMQNGMGSQEAVADAFSHLNVHAATTTEGALRRSAGHVVHAGRGTTRIGLLTGSEHGWASLLQAAGLSAEAVADTRWHLANKLRINALINPLTVLFNCCNGDLLEHSETLTCMRALGAEADAVLGAAGFRFTDSAFDTAAAVARATAANHSSMLQDARAGRRLELAHITGYLLRLSERVDLPTPEHQSVYADIAARWQV